MIYRIGLFILIGITSFLFSCDQPASKNEELNKIMNDKQTVATTKSFIPSEKNSVSKDSLSARKPSCCVGAPPSRFAFKPKLTK